VRGSIVVPTMPRTMALRNKVVSLMCTRQAAAVDSLPNDAAKHISVAKHHIPIKQSSAVQEPRLWPACVIRPPSNACKRGRSFAMPDRRSVDLVACRLNSQLHHGIDRLRPPNPF
jgi:hypothetical protein